MIFSDRLESAVERSQNPCLLGIDPHLDLLPDEFSAARDATLPRAERAEALARFGEELVDVAAGLVPAVKPQSAFFEVLGADGVAAFERVVAYARQADLLVIGDVKRSDIASTAAAYATAFLEGSPGLERQSLCDAITVNPYLGTDSVEPFLDACGRTDAGLYVLVRTSNPGSDEFQAAGEPKLAHVIAEAVRRWGEATVGDCGFSSIGAVVGVTKASELAGFRAQMPQTPFLLPGYGAQGGTARDVVAAFPDSDHPYRGALINASRSIGFAYRKSAYQGRHWKDAARHALESMVSDVRTALHTSTATR